MRRLAAFLFVSALWGADALEQVTDDLGLSSSQQRLVIRLNAQFDDAYRAGHRRIETLQARRAIDPAANVASELDEIRKSLWNQLVEINRALRNALTSSQREKLDTLMESGRAPEFAAAANELRLAKKPHLPRTAPSKGGPTTVTDSAGQVDSAASPPKRKDQPF